MRILIAPDKYKGTLSALEAARAMEKACRTQYPDAVILLQPIADGGEGSLDALRLTPGFTENHCSLTGAHNKEIQVQYLTHGNSAYLETAHIIGLALPDLPPIRRRSTAGVGQWALQMFAKKYFDLQLFLGGSASCDGGFGLAQTLGFSFLDDAMNSVDFLDILKARQVHFPALPDPNVAFTCYCDVQSPLTGSNGAAQLYGPQKGASPQDVVWLESALAHMQELFRKASGKSESEIPGSGAAGGLALPLAFWPGAGLRILPGARFILERTGISKLLGQGQIQLALTGEGCTDRSTLQGKAVYQLILQAQNSQVPCAIISGSYANIDELQNLPVFLHVRGRPQSRAEAARNLELATLAFLKKIGGAR